MAETYSKKEKDKKKAKKLKDKAIRREERKLNNNKGKDFEDMIVYVDANGHFTDTKPSEEDKIEISLDEIQLGAAPKENDSHINKGTVSHYNEEKGYGFINDHKSSDSIFVHVNNISEPFLKQGDKVTFEKERGPKGYVAVNVIKIK